MPSLDPAKRYFVSVLPSASGYSNGGAPIAAAQFSAGQVRVAVDGPAGANGAGRIPTAQVRVQLFRDDSPLNGALDGDESGLAGFSSGRSTRPAATRARATRSRATATGSC
jgi:hypothetical protein